MDRSQYTLCSLPLELLEIVVRYLDGKSSVNLLMTNKTLLARLESNCSFWRHVCQTLDLCSSEWTLGEEHDTETELWKSVYKRFVKIESALQRDGTQFGGQRILSDLSCYDRINKNSQVQPLSLPNQQIVNLSMSRKLENNFKTLKKTLISDCIIRLRGNDSNLLICLQNYFSYSLSEEYFVLVVSSSTTLKSYLTVWRISEDPITYSHSVSSHDLSDVWLACSEDLLIAGDILVLLASPAKPSNYVGGAAPASSHLLLFYNLRSQTSVGSFSLQDQHVRFLPHILKDGGGSKIFHWLGTILAVCPEIDSKYYQAEPELEGRVVLRVFDSTLLQAGGTDQSLQVAEYPVRGVALKLPYSYMASDQKGPHIVLSFSKQYPDHLSQQFLILSLANKSQIIQSVRTFDSSNMSR